MSVAATVPEEWQDHVRECILYDLLFKAAMVDYQALYGLPLFLSYHSLLESLSCFAERRHHELRRALLDRNCRILEAKNKKGMYLVMIRKNGYLHELIYSPELLRAECEVRMQEWLMTTRNSFSGSFVLSKETGDKRPGTRHK